MLHLFLVVQKLCYFCDYFKWLKTHQNAEENQANSLNHKNENAPSTEQ